MSTLNVRISIDKFNHFPIVRVRFGPFYYASSLICVLSTCVLVYVCTYIFKCVSCDVFVLFFSLLFIPFVGNLSTVKCRKVETIEMYILLLLLMLLVWLESCLILIASNHFSHCNQTNK